MNRLPMATSEAKERLNIFLPKDLVEELRARVPSRHRTAFIEQALTRELHHLRLLEAINTTAGTWSAEDHPELTSSEAIAQWVKGQRAPDLQAFAPDDQGRLTLIPANARMP